MKYQHRQNGTVVELFSTNEKFKTVEIQEEGQDKTKSMSLSTFKRWWRPVGGEETETTKVSSEVPDKTSSKNSHVKEKSTKERKPRKPALPNEAVISIMEFIKDVAEQIGAEEYVREKQPKLHNFKIPNGEIKSVIFLAIVSRNKVELYSKHKWLDAKVASKMTPVNKNIFDLKYSITELDKEAKSVITDVINSFK